MACFNRLADKLRQTDAYHEAQEKLRQQKVELLHHLEKFFTGHPSWSETMYFGKSGNVTQYGMDISDCNEFLKSEGFRVGWHSNGYGVQYLKISL